MSGKTFRETAASRALRAGRGGRSAFGAGKKRQGLPQSGPRRSSIKIGSERRRKPLLFGADFPCRAVFLRGSLLRFLLRQPLARLPADRAARGGAENLKRKKSPVLGAAHSRRMNAQTAQTKTGLYRRKRLCAEKCVGGRKGLLRSHPMLWHKITFMRKPWEPAGPNLQRDGK